MFLKHFCVHIFFFFESTQNVSKKEINSYIYLNTDGKGLIYVMHIYRKYFSRLYHIRVDFKWVLTLWLCIGLCTTVMMWLCFCVIVWILFDVLRKVEGEKLLADGNIPGYSTGNGSGHSRA